MKPLDPLRARYGSLSDTVLQTIETFSPAAVKCLRALPHLIRVYEAAYALNLALAEGQRAYDEQGKLNALFEEGLE